MTEKVISSPNQETTDEQSGENSPEELRGIEEAAAGTEVVLENALQNGEPSHQVKETERGIKGVVDASIPGGSLEATFNGVGQDAELEEIDITLDEGEETHGIAVKHMDMPPPEIFIDGEPVRPEDVPAIQAVVERIQAEQSETDDGEADTTERLEVSDIPGKIAGFEAMAAGLGDIDLRLGEIEGALQDIQGELGSIGEKLGKFFEILIELFTMLEEELNKLADEKDEEKQEEIKKGIQEKLEEFVARLRAI